MRTTFRRVTGLFIRRFVEMGAEDPRGGKKVLQYAHAGKSLAHPPTAPVYQFRKAGYSFVTAFRNGLMVGLPFSALLAAIMPVLGMSWYFDTENWASGIWDGYAGSRAEVWREAMIKVSGEKIGPGAFRLHRCR